MGAIVSVLSADGVTGACGSSLGGLLRPAVEIERRLWAGRPATPGATAAIGLRRRLRALPASPAGEQLARVLDGGPRVRFGRIVVSEIEVPNILVNLV